jgi:hypothetical protein
MDQQMTSWRSRTDLAAFPEGESSSSQVVICRELVLPPFPCFRSYRDPEIQDRLTGKSFTKQITTVSARYVDFEPAKQANAAAALVSKMVNIDAEDLFSGAMTDVKSHDSKFNRFETSRAHREAKKASTKKPPTKPSARVGAAVGIVVSDEELEHRANPSRPAGGLMDIFSIDGLF